MIGGFDTATILAQDNQVANGTYHVNFGADGDAAMLVAVHDGAVNGYNLATTDLGGGITSVHVTGNGDDTFYYTTQAVNGGVELERVLRRYRRDSKRSVLYTADQPRRNLHV
ncbi:hypothetical protein H8B02_13415 [Bradyrhizobium sp. Pear77]|uniref:hypothetical protein n=1 Tax=Bradyrhizobium TaxID=374 RepID=UPI001E343F6A|nr:MULTISPECIES: hypothetical protein [Bradyrhizobium]MCC8954411.1 hypothetical protein [Bradyrhizobium altum]MCC8961794.1 hypothetical protein [Bradyrhizobium oropedii]